MLIYTLKHDKNIRVTEETYNGIKVHLKQQNRGIQILLHVTPSKSIYGNLNIFEIILDIPYQNYFSLNHVVYLVNGRERISK